MMQEAAIPKSNLIPMPATQPEQRGLFDMPKCTFTSTALIIEPGLPIDDWVELGKRLGKAEGSLSIWRGDYINYGKHEYKKKYESALALTGLKKGTLQNDVWLANAIPTSLRSEELTTHHYKHLAPLRSKSKIRKWIERALKGDKGKLWSAPRLRKEINKGSTSPSKTEENKHYLDSHYKQFLLDYIASQNSFLNRCTYEPFKREIERTIKRAKYQLGRTETSDYEAVLKEVDEGAATTEEIAESVPIAEVEIDAFCERAIGCPRPTKREDRREAGTKYMWRPIGVKIAIGKGVRPHGIFRKDAPGGDDFDSGYHPIIEYGEKEDRA